MRQKWLAQKLLPLSHYRTTRLKSTDAPWVDGPRSGSLSLDLPLLASDMLYQNSISLQTTDLEKKNRVFTGRVTSRGSDCVRVTRPDLTHPTRPVISLKVPGPTRGSGNDPEKVSKQRRTYLETTSDVPRFGKAWRRPLPLPSPPLPPRWPGKPFGPSYARP